MGPIDIKGLISVDPKSREYPLRPIKDIRLRLNQEIISVHQIKAQLDHKARILVRPYKISILVSGLG